MEAEHRPDTQTGRTAQIDEIKVWKRFKIAFACIPVHPCADTHSGVCVGGETGHQSGDVLQELSALLSGDRDLGLTSSAKLASRGAPGSLLSPLP